MTRLLVIGLDGATFDVIEPWVAEGDLPNLGRLMKDGAWGRLRSVVPALTYPAWASFATGLLPGNTGIYEFYRRDPASYRERMHLSHDLVAPTLWDILNGHGLTVGLVAFPNTYPTRPLKGFAISGIVAPDTRAAGFCYPTDLFERHGLDRSRYRIEGRPLREIGEDYLGYLGELETMIGERRRVALTLMEREPWDAFVIHEIGTDAVSHAMWRFMDPRSPCFVPDAPAACRDGVRRIYRAADAMVGALMATAGSDVLTVVLSDHGNGPTTRYININVLLRDLGFLTTKDGLMRVLLEDYAVRHVPPALRGPVNGLGRAWGALPGALGRAGDWLLERTAARLPRIGPMIDGLPRAAIDFARTRAYAFGNRGGIYVNRAGREPEGLVSAAEYEAVRGALVDALRSVRDAEGRPVFPRACLAEAVYRGRYAHLGPDVLTSDTDEEGYFFSSQSVDGHAAFDTVRPYCSGMHTPDGILLMHGPGLAAGARLAGAHIVDVLPTALHALGLPVPREMDGRVLADVFRATTSVAFAESSGERQAAAAASSEAEDAILLRRLKDLGYLD